MDWKFIISLAVPLLATAVGYFASQRRLDKQQEEINALQLAKMKREEENEKKAQLSVDSSYEQLYVKNIGIAEAVNIRFSCSDNLVTNPDINSLFPYQRLRSGQSIKMRFAKEFLENTTQVITLKWDDEAGKDNEIEMTVKLS